jgi:hypothetical protein
MLQVERHVVAVETDYRPADQSKLFEILIAEAVKKMDLLLALEGRQKLGREGGAK